MSAPPQDKPRRLRAYDDDDIVRFAMGLDVPIVGLVRNREEYREMREIALIYGTTLGLSGKIVPPAVEDDAPDAPEAPSVEERGEEIPLRVRGGDPRAPGKGES